MKSCSECIFGYHTPCDNCNDENSEFIPCDVANKLAKIEAQNSELKQIITGLEKAIDELERITNRSLKRRSILIDDLFELKQELEVHKWALLLAVKMGLYERMEQPLEGDVHAEMEWLLGTARRHCKND